MKKTRIIPMAALLGLLFILPPVAYGRQNDTGPSSAQKPTFRVGMYRKVNTFTMNLLIEKKLGDQLVVMLLDERGRVLHKEVVGRKWQKYSRLLNFEQTGDGTYTVVVKKGEEQISKEIRLSTLKLYEMPKRLLIAQD